MPNCDLSGVTLADQCVNLEVPDLALNEMERAASPHDRTNGGEGDRTRGEQLGTGYMILFAQVPAQGWLNRMQSILHWSGRTTSGMT